MAVRIGPNYARNKTKAPSDECLYRTAAVRCYRTKRRTRNVADVLPLPLAEAFGEVEERVGFLPDWVDDGDGELEGFVPDLLIAHFQLPYESPNVFKPKDDGEGGEIVFYLTPTRRFLDEMSGRRPPRPASCVFARWCRSCTTDASVRSKFKCLAMIRDMERHNLGWMSPYNGKPVLITESGSARCGVRDNGLRFLEISANVHKWSFLAKKGFVSLLPKFCEMRVDFGFTVEADDDDDLPECIIGATCVNYVDASAFPAMDAELQHPAAHLQQKSLGQKGTEGIS